jgi:carbohydrate diacid regulator
MLLHHEFLHNIILKHDTNDGLSFHITNAEGYILASTDSRRHGTKSRTSQSIIATKLPAVTESQFRKYKGNVSYGTPIFSEKKLHGSVIVHGLPEIAPRHGESIRTAVESALEYAAFSRNMENGGDATALIAKMLLDDKHNTEKLLSLMHRHEIDPALLRTVICISLRFIPPGSSADLDLEHQANREHIRTKVVNRLKENRYLNSQDIVYLYDMNTIAVIKSFLPSSDTSRVFPALDVICRDMEKTLDEFNAVSFAMAYGNLYSGTGALKTSLDEAMDSIRLGQDKRPHERRYTLEDVFFEKVFRHLCPQIAGKVIEPAILKLRGKDKAIPKELINCAEALVDNCMNFSATAKNHHIHRNTIGARLERFKALTGLEPANSFRDAFIAKMLAVYIRQYKDGGQPR